MLSGSLYYVEYRCSQPCHTSSSWLIQIVWEAQCDSAKLFLNYADNFRVRKTICDSDKLCLTYSYNSRVMQADWCACITGLRSDHETKGYSKKKHSIFKDIIQIEVDPPSSHPIFDKVLILLTFLPLQNFRQKS